jgi:hypothetical protein
MVLQVPAPQPSRLPSLYDQDFLQWTEDIVAKLKGRDFANLDLDHLIEEVEALGRSERRELLNRLTRLLEHLLKRLYVPSEPDYRGWQITIRNQRLALRNLLQTSPSLRTIWDTTLETAWLDALNLVQEDYPQVTFPDRFPYPTDPEFLLHQAYWNPSTP